MDRPLCIYNLFVPVYCFSSSIENGLRQSNIFAFLRREHLPMHAINFHVFMSRFLIFKQLMEYEVIHDINATMSSPWLQLHFVVWLILSISHFFAHFMTSGSHVFFSFFLSWRASYVFVFCVFCDIFMTMMLKKGLFSYIWMR